MAFELVLGIFLPFFGTLLGAGCVVFLKKGAGRSFLGVFSGFAAGVMTAASIWSLLIPAIEYSSSKGRLAFLPAATGFLLGVAALIAADRFIPIKNLFSESGESSHKTAMLSLSVTAHNLPEGIAVGAVYAALLEGGSDVTGASALALSLGVALQNLPEGAIISLPLYASGVSRKKAFFVGTLSGVVEPVGALLAIAAARYLSLLPFLLGFAAGAMIYVVIEELVPDLYKKKAAVWQISSFTAGFLLMMSLDVALG